MRAGRYATLLLEPDEVRVPLGLHNLNAFRAWVRSAAFPEQGRIDWIGGELEIDMSPEELNTHGSPKTAVARELARLVEDQDRGTVYIDATRLSVPAANVSAEPDVLVLLFDSVEAGRVRLVPKAKSRRGRYVEIEGPADLVVECVSDSSETKDRERLPGRYWLAGVREYWLVDARGDGAPELTIHRRGRSAFQPVRPGRDGFARSPLLAVAVKLVALQPRAGLVRYRLLTR